MLTCRCCGHAEILHRHIRDGGCAGRRAIHDPRVRRLTGLNSVRCGCTRNPSAGASDIDDPSEDVLAGQERRDDELRREDPSR